MTAARPFRGLRIAFVVLLAFAALGTAGWLLYRTFRPPSAELTSSHGHFGDGFWWGEGHDSAVVCWPTKPAEINRPAFMVLLRLPDGVTAINHGHRAMVGGSEYEIELTASVDLATGRNFKGRYFATDKAPGEQIVFDGKEYPTTAGRLILVDLTGAEPSVVQVPADLKSVLQNPASPSDPTTTDPRPAIRAALSQLRSRHEEVRRFLDGSPLK